MQIGYYNVHVHVCVARARDKNASDAVMEVVRKTISQSGFEFQMQEQQARILDGREEGSFSWVTANYLSGNFGKVFD